VRVFSHKKAQKAQSAGLYKYSDTGLLVSVGMVDDLRLRIIVRPDDVCSAIHLRSNEHTDSKRKERNSDSKS